MAHGPTVGDFVKAATKMDAVKGGQRMLPDSMYNPEEMQLACKQMEITMEELEEKLKKYHAEVVWSWEGPVIVFGQERGRKK